MYSNRYPRFISLLFTQIATQFFSLSLFQIPSFNSSFDQRSTKFSKGVSLFLAILPFPNHFASLLSNLSPLIDLRISGKSTSIYC